MANNANQMHAQEEQIYRFFSIDWQHSTCAANNPAEPAGSKIKKRASRSSASRDNETSF
jgi:hypothetical protein